MIFSDGQFPRNRKVNPAGWQEEIAGRRNRRRSDGQRTTADIRMRDTAAVPDLAVNAAAGAVHRIRDAAPCRDLVGAVQARRPNDAVRLR